MRRRPKDKPYGDLMIPLIGEVDAGADARPGRRPATLRCRCPTPLPPMPAPVPATPRPGGPGLSVQPGTTRSARRRTPCRRSTSPRRSPPGRPGGVGGPAGADPPGRPPSAPASRRASFPSIPGMNMTDVGPDRNDPFPNRSFADIITSVEEAPTGRFMLGVGANSFQGLMGSVTDLREELRHLQRPPTPSTTSPTARRSAAAARSSRSTSWRAP